jgi:hypothetical protein
MSSAAAVSAQLWGREGEFLSVAGTLTDKMWLLPNSGTFITQCKTKNAHFSITKTTVFILHHLLLSQNFLFNFKFPLDFSWLKNCNFVYNTTAFTLNSRSGLKSRQDRIKIRCTMHLKKHYCMHCTSRHNMADKALVISHSPPELFLPLPWYFK